MKQSTPQIQIGKSGITEPLIAEIKAQLKKRKILKVRILKSARTADRKEIAQEVAERAKADLLVVRGNTFTLSKR
ncbi:MAG: RNA-binding protein [Candidatus Altiarchaeales archaeon]|nr:MAG: RNA-binding protein [Candidatus Altiarchaeales archaeon]